MDTRPYLDEAREHHKTRLKYYELLDLLGNLMAVINGDGGHRAESFGAHAEAVEDCIDTLRNERAKKP